MIIEAEKWKHKTCRSSKIGHPVFDGKAWRCSRCESGYYVDFEGCLQEKAESFFWGYLAHISFVASPAEGEILGTV